MSLKKIVLCLGILTLSVPRLSRAATPEVGHVAFQGAAGLHAPFESEEKLGFEVEGSAEYFWRQRIGFRATVGYARSTSKFPDNPIAATGYLLGSGVYNFEMGNVHSFGLVGIGVYAVSPAVGGSTARFGVHAGGGAEYFLNRRTSVTGQGLFHFLGSVNDQKASFFGVTAGIRYYF
jgi:opacity protein-like surface antigen